MTADGSTADLVASLKAYLEELKESGVDGLPWAPPQGNAPVPAKAGTGEEVPVPIAGVPVEGESLDRIRGDLGECQRCALGGTRTTLVFGVGNPRARIVFVGEAPGRDEDLQGEPFVGEAGQLLNRIITRMGLKREDVYICNVLKCRPPGNRNPEPHEIDQCGPFMLRQVKAIAPEAIVTLGTFATQTLLGTKAPISKLRGKFHDYHGIPLMPTFHPSFLLHNKKDTSKFWNVWDDMVQVLQKLDMTVPDVKRKE
ncbi:uracil-DNA glycosylase [Geomobilimonas luticola]|uniref:Type-4 uracil-DNA glycosylase n=1 Tax=Geomobilimonas luticola TaxID=1114878 RepID=A0ABS5SEI8_9BACT|nr:uracil-DNA glycosylase [Geomobilimonas luticola]MBT0653600.1 uracil-DNA glycosylase [Geomobilimonas luticola]